MIKWRFWKNSGLNTETHSRPKDVPDIVGRKLTIHLGKGPDWIWNLKAVARSRPDMHDVYDIRIFNAADAALKHATIRNFYSLNTHPELIIFEGTYDKKENKVEIIDRTNSLDLDIIASRTGRQSSFYYLNTPE
jgi:hypothetical protein